MVVHPAWSGNQFPPPLKLPPPFIRPPPSASIVALPIEQLAVAAHADRRLIRPHDVNNNTPFTHGVNTHAYITLWPYRRGPYGVGVVPEAAKPPLNATTREFGARIRARREELGLSQEAAAIRCGIHWTQLGKVERGQRSVRLENIVKIAFGLDVVPGVLLDGVPPPHEEDHSAE